MPDNSSMQDYIRSLNEHYGQEGLSENILAALQHAGKDLSALTREDVRAFDEFHIGGRTATRELAQQAGLLPGMQVLDLGSGVGGPARTLAAEFGCRVIGLEIVHEYVRAAQMLTDRVGLKDKVRFRQGSATEMPFEDEFFDVVWVQHALMNIAEKPRLFAEVRRVLRPHGRLALHEICAGPVSPVHLPVPWASKAELNYVISSQAFYQLINRTGFKELAWEDLTASSLAWFRRRLDSLAARPQDAPPALGMDLLMGASTAEKAENIVRNLAENRIVVVQGVFERQG